MKSKALTPGEMLISRRLLQWSRDRLAMRMGVSARAIGRFENEGLAVGDFDARRAREVLEAAESFSL